MGAGGGEVRLVGRVVHDALLTLYLTGPRDVATATAGLPAGAVGVGALALAAAAFVLLTRRVGGEVVQ